MSTGTTAVCTGLHLYERSDIELLKDVLARAPQVVVLLDGANRARSSHLHPFTVGEQQEMLAILFPAEISSGRLVSAGLDVEPYDTRKQHDAMRDALGSLGITLEGGYCTAIIPNDQRRKRISRLLSGIPADAPAITAATGSASLFQSGRSDVPEMLQPWLETWKTSYVFKSLKKEAEFSAQYIESWSSSPYPPTFNAADALIECEGHLLMISRGNHPFRGLFALPGGMLEQDEPLFQTALREAAEETCLPASMLEEHCISSRTFDDPLRDPRGRFVSTTYHFRIPGPPPEVAAADGELDARWLPIEKLKPSIMAFDHWSIVREMLDIGERQLTPTI